MQNGQHVCRSGMLVLQLGVTSTAAFVLTQGLPSSCTVIQVGHYCLWPPAQLLVGCHKSSGTCCLISSTNSLCLQLQRVQHMVPREQLAMPWRAIAASRQLCLFTEQYCDTQMCFTAAKGASPHTRRLLVSHDCKALNQNVQPHGHGSCTMHLTFFNF